MSYLFVIFSLGSIFTMIIAPKIIQNFSSKFIGLLTGFIISFLWVFIPFVSSFYQMAVLSFIFGSSYGIIEIVLNKDVWNGMSETQQAQWEASVRQANVWSMTHSNAIQNAALKTLQEEKGVEIVKFDDEMLKAMRAAFNETMDELMATDPEVKMLMDDLTAFMEDYKAWENIGSIGRNSLWD